MEARVPTAKIRDLKKSLQQVLRQPVQTPRLIHSLTMRIQAATFALLPARLYTRHLLRHKNQTVRQSSDWDQPQPLPPECLKEIRTWMHRLQQWNGRSFLPQTPKETLFVDASDTGWGCHWQQQTTHGYWNQQEAQQSINWRESVEVLSETPDPLNSPTYTGCGEQHSGQGIAQVILQEPVENTPNSVSNSATTIRVPRRRSVCRSNYTRAPKVRVLETRSGRAYPRRIQSQLVSVPQSLDQPSLEHDHQVSTEITTRAGSTGNHCDTSLAVSTVLSSSGNTGDTTTSSSDTSKSSGDASTSNQSFTAEELEAFRVAYLNKKFGTSAELTIDSQQFLSTSLTCDSTTNRTYKAAQLAFVEWALQNNISINTFSADDLVNFLVHIRYTRNYQLNTLKLWRSATSRFHREPSTLANCSSLHSFFSTVASETAPRHIHRPTIDFSPTLVHLSNILSDISTSLTLLQQKLAFLLGMVALLRPSDLARISLLSAKVDPQSGILTFDIVAPKERRNQVRIIKPFHIHPHPDTRLCPVQCFQAVLAHPHASSRPPDVLFVNSANPTLPVKSSTISSWLRRLLLHSTSESRVSVRSLGSSLALRSGIPVDDIVTLGNWRSSETFHKFYRREHMSTVNFTTSILEMTAAPIQVEELDDLDPQSPVASDFVDASDTFPDVPSLDQQL
ncbi:hypothetical protein G6F35_002007 [Rhizopus arrhizus]|nr:hypothetical protein G6F35_002007 [Rhizopus arrhizus]